MKMTKSIIVVGSIITMLAVGSYVISSYFQATKLENSVFAIDESMQNTWAMSSNSLKMVGFNLEKYPKDFVKAIEANAKRYQGDKASMMLWVKESQSQLSPDLYRDFSKSVEKVYYKKEAVQKNKISIVQSNRDFRNASIKGTISKILFGFPTDKCLAIEDRIISNKKTKQTWESGNDEVENPFKS